MISTIEYFIGILITALLLLAIITKYKNTEKEWIPTAIFIGLVSLPVCLFLLEQGILYILIINIILSIFYGIIRKNPKVFLKTLLVAFLVSVIVYVGWFNVSMGGGLHVNIQKYDGIEEMPNRTYSGNNIVLMTEEDLNKRQGIKKAIDDCVNYDKCDSNVDSSEWDMHNNVSPFVKINGRYYLLTFYEPD